MRSCGQDLGLGLGAETRRKAATACMYLGHELLCPVQSQASERKTTSEDLPDCADLTVEILCVVSQDDKTAAKEAQQPSCKPYLEGYLVPSSRCEKSCKWGNNCSHPSYEP